MLRHRVCDLDILLDPFILVTPPTQLTAEYPSRQDFSDHFAELDDNEPWRAYYWNNLDDHPSLRDPRVRKRIQGKFFGPSFTELRHLR